MLAVFAAVVSVLLLFVLLGLGSDEGLGGAVASDLVDVETDSRVGGVSGEPAYPGGDPPPEDELPPESTMSYRASTLSSRGGILGLWEPRGWLSGSHGGSPAKNRADPHLA